MSSKNSKGSKKTSTSSKTSTRTTKGLGRHSTISKSSTKATKGSNSSKDSRLSNLSEFSMSGFNEGIVPKRTSLKSKSSNTSNNSLKSIKLTKKEKEKYENNLKEMGIEREFEEDELKMFKHYLDSTNQEINIDNEEEMKDIRLNLVFTDLKEIVGIEDLGNIEMYQLILLLNNMYQINLSKNDLENEYTTVFENRKDSLTSSGSNISTRMGLRKIGDKQDNLRKKDKDYAVFGRRRHDYIKKHGGRKS